MIKATVVNQEYLFGEGKTFYLSECTNGIIDGFHVYVNADGTGHCCNLSRNDAKRIFNV